MTLASVTVTSNKLRCQKHPDQLISNQIFSTDCSANSDSCPYQFRWSFTVNAPLIHCLGFFLYSFRPDCNHNCYYHTTINFPLYFSVGNLGHNVGNDCGTGTTILCFHDAGLHLSEEQKSLHLHTCSRLSWFSCRHIFLLIKQQLMHLVILNLHSWDHLIFSSHS